jgi:hypothetical protein
MTHDEFINKEVATWGEDYIFALLDSGFEPVELVSETGEVKWTWIKQSLTTLGKSATMHSGGRSAFLPFRGLSA